MLYDTYILTVVLFGLLFAKFLTTRNNTQIYLLEPNLIKRYTPKMLLKTLGQLVNRVSKFFLSSKTGLNPDAKIP
jgi:hypothetical protein